MKFHASCARFAFFASFLGLLLAIGCETTPARRSSVPLSASSSAVAHADDEYLYFRFNPGDPIKTIQASDETVALLLDSDSDPSTGYQRPEKPFASFGADLEIQFSPINPTGGKPRAGVAMYRFDREGARSELDASKSDFSFAPTYASQWYDARISRFFAGSSGLPLAGMGSRGNGRGAFVIYDQNGRIVGYSDPFNVEFPQIASNPRYSVAQIPAKSPEALRIVSWNVWGKLQDNPEKFCAVLRALNPDIIMLSEWKGDAETLEMLLNKHMTGEIGIMVAWNAVVGPDVAIASRFQVAPAGPSAVEINWNGEKRKVRFVSATVQSPAGPALVGTMHLKCCGGMGSNEDNLRIAEADAINQAMRQISRADAADIRIFGGDLNLVGSRPPLDILCMNLDADGSDLTPADPVVLGDDVLYTWRDWSSGFSPGRLDWLVYSDSSAQPANQFVFDPMRLEASTLSKVGLTRATGQPSDHLPLVLDLRPTLK